MTRFAEVAAAAEVPGIVALAARGDDVHVEVHGEVRRDTQFRIASVTKPVTAADAGMLVDEGLLALDEPVDRLLPELADRRVLRRRTGRLDDTVPAARPITVRDVLSSGASAWSGSGPDRRPVLGALAGRLHAPARRPRPPARPRQVDRRSAGAPVPQPGARWLYHGRGRCWGCSSLGRRTAARGPVVDAGVRAAGHERHRIPRPATGGPRHGVLRRGRVGPARGAVGRPPAFPDGAAGLVSTVDDLLAFARSLADRPPMTRDQLTPAQRATAQASGFLGDEALKLGATACR